MNLPPEKSKDQEQLHPCQSRDKKKGMKVSNSATFIPFLQVSIN